MPDPNENSKEAEDEAPDSLTVFENDLNDALERSTDGMQDEDE